MESTEPASRAIDQSTETNSPIGEDQARTVWITGAGGLIGSHLARLAPPRFQGARIVPLTRTDLDLTEAAAVRERFLREQPRLVFHCAALSRSPSCRVNPPLARRLNVEVTARLAEQAADVAFFFLSSDLVFDGREGHYAETAPVHPLSVYAETKVEAERIVLANPRHTVIRTSLNYGTSPTGDRAFNEEMVRAWQSGRTLRLFTDEFRSPIAAQVTARLLWELAGLNRPGLYHLAGTERLSRWQIGRLLAAGRPEFESRIESASLREYAGEMRAPDTSLNCAKLEKLRGAPLPRFSEWLRSSS